MNNSYFPAIDLPDLPVLKLGFSLRPSESIVLPPFLGSTIRGAFGGALKEVFCFVKGGDCKKCWFFEACPYQMIFESPNLLPKEKIHSLLKGHKELPQPFILIPPALRKKKTIKPRDPRVFLDLNEEYENNHFSRDELLNFSIILVGTAITYFNQVLAAVWLMAHSGMGEAKIPFELEYANAHDSRGRALEIFNSAAHKVNARDVAPISLRKISKLRLGSMFVNGSDARELDISFLTPARLRIADTISNNLSFYEFLKKTTERIEFLSRTYGNTESEEYDYRPILDFANNIALKTNNLNRNHYYQYSNRQEREIRREVLMGNIQFQGEHLREFAPYLIAGEMLNVGNGASAGLGAYEINIMDD